MQWCGLYAARAQWWFILSLYIQSQLQNALSEEIQKRQARDILAIEQKEALDSTGMELRECKKFLTKECATNSCLKQELNQFKVSIVVGRRGCMKCKACMPIIFAV